MQKGKIIALIIIIILAVIAMLLVYFYDNSQKEDVEVLPMETETNKNGKSTEEITNSDVKYLDISTKDAYRLMHEDAELIIIDVSLGYDEGHLPGAVNYYAGDGSFDDVIPTLDKAKTYLVYGHEDSITTTGAEKLTEAGFENVYRLKGNYVTWKREGYPIEIVLRPVSDVAGELNASTSFLDGEFKNIVIGDVPVPAEGKFYEGWLVEPGSSDFFSIGELKKIDDIYMLEYSDSESKSGYNQIIITLEAKTDGFDGIPETHIFKGEFDN